MPPRRCSCRRLHSEKYMEVAKFAIDFAAKEFKSREQDV